MKKSIAFLTLCVIGSLLSSTGYAKQVFDDVPKGHWSYEAIERLAKDHIIEGIGNNFFAGEKEATRYEMAVIVGKAMENEEKADIEQKALIEKLEREYQTELKNMGIRMDVMEAKLGTVDKKVDKFQVHGYFGVRYDNWNNTPLSNSSVLKKTTQLDLDTTYKINDQIEIHTENIFNRSFLSEAADYTNLSIQQYVRGTFDDFNFKIGRFKDYPGYGMTYSEPMQGVEVGFGHKLKSILRYGKYAPTTSIESSTADSSTNALYSVDLYPSLVDKTFHSIELDYPLSRVINIKGLYQTKPDTSSDPTIGSGTKFYEFGFDSRLSKNLKITTATTKSDADTDNKGYGVMLQYGAGFPPIRGNYALYTGYVKMPANACIVSGGLNQTFIGDYFSAVGEGFKGSIIGMQYSPYNDVMVSAFYMNGKTTNYCVVNSAPAGSTKNIFRTQVDFLF